MNITYINEDTKTYHKNKESYTIDDCVLVRTTAHFPHDRIVQTPKNAHAYSYESSSYFAYAIGDYIDKIEPNLSYLERKLAIEEMEKGFKVFFPTYRSTVHFAINGRVGSHGYGNFEERDFIIIEPLSHHIDEESLIGLRGNDTYFNDDIILSEEASIVIAKEKFEKMQQDSSLIEELSKFRIFVYEGDEIEAVGKAIQLLGYDTYTVNGHGYVEDEGMKMISFLRQLSLEKGISNEPHAYSESKLNDDQERMKASQEIDDEHLTFILENLDVSDELKEEINLQRQVGTEEDMQKSIVKLIEKVGPEKIIEATQKYNKEVLQKFQEKTSKK